MNRDTIIALLLAGATVLFVLMSGKKEASPAAEGEKARFVAGYGTPVIDGEASDAVWQKAPWQPLDQLWLGSPPDAADFSGRYKMLWDENFLYLLADITDDTLIDIHPDGLDHYWDDDCLEVFVDEDASGGIHQYNYNAFAYHIALDGKVVDIAPDSSYQYFNDHCFVKRRTEGRHSSWEVAIKIFDGKRYADHGENIAKSLRSGKQMGFMVAYCDNDHSPEREHFVGSVPISGEDKNRGWIDAGTFGLLKLE